eukprot:XP_003724720.1 PREDICTED: m7GpppX diphosphatase isoform X1 [Strongylocentrotus purpuratus]
MAENPPKRQKTSESEEKIECDALRNFKGFKIKRILNQNLSSKSVFLLGNLYSESSPGSAGDASSGTPEGGVACDDADPQSSGNDQAVVLLEKTAFTEDLLPTLMSDKSVLNRSMQNDIYGVYECFPPKELSGIKTTLIYPATEKHIQKYSAQDVHLINESYQDYKNITLPYIEEKQFNIQWVYNILEKKAESERIVSEDPDPETGFVMLPDMKWDEKQTSNLYLIVIIHQRGIKSLRDLSTSHLPLLRNIQEKCSKCIQEKYSIPADELRAYLHYQPSYYHLHVHFTHLKFNAPGTNVDRAHLLSSVIENIELMPDYYQRKPLAYVLRENDGLLAKFREARAGNGQ